MMKIFAEIIVYLAIFGAIVGLYYRHWRTRQMPAGTVVPTELQTWWLHHHVSITGISLMYLIGIPLLWGALWKSDPDLTGFPGGTLFWAGFVLLIIFSLWKPVIGFAGTTLVIIFIVVVGMIIQVRQSEYGQKMKAGEEYRQKQRNAPRPTSANVTLSAKDGWVPIRVLMGVGKTWVAQTQPRSATVSVRMTDGKIHEGGAGHERDTWNFEMRNQSEWQTWFVATNEESPVTYTVTWSN